MIVAPTIIVQVVAIYLFFYTYVDNISKHMARGVLGEMMFIKKSIKLKGNKDLVYAFSRNIDLRFYFQPGKKLGATTKTTKQRFKENKMLEFFDPAPITDPLNRFKIELENQGFTPFFIKQDPRNRDNLILRTQVPEGVLIFYIPTKRITSSSKYVFMAWMVFTSILTSIIAILFLKNQIRSIKGLSIAAEKLGRGGDAPDFKPSGAAEIRSVGISFIRMKERIMRQISGRTQMLSAVSHDLRTPLTRMKLQLEMMEENEATKDLKSDISDMEKMVNEYLNFAKSADTRREKEVETNVKEFLQNIGSYYQKMHKNIVCELKIDDDFTIAIKKNALKRAIRNLIDNSFNYGDEVKISAHKTKNALKIVVDDNGCGIPEEKRSEIFKPFYRIDNSRNLDKANKKGGAGLGLAIVMDVVNSHGGRIDVDDSPMKGLRMIISLPI